MLFRQLLDPETGTYTYLIADLATKEAVLVDPLKSNTRAHRFYERLGFLFSVERRFGEDSCFVYRLARPPVPAASA